jgi:hypothetical protein
MSVFITLFATAALAAMQENVESISADFAHDLNRVLTVSDSSNCATSKRLSSGYPYLSSHFRHQVC